MAKKKKKVKISKKKTGKKKKEKSRKSTMMYLSLGSNIGDREEYIEQAIFLVSKISGVSVVKRASNYETEPEGGPDQPSFINTAISIKTSLSPQKLFEGLQEIETTLGREKEVEWGPRTIDIDILLVEGQIVSDDKLQIPHQRLHERMFVLKPLREIAPDLVHPVLEKTIEALYQEKVTESNSTYDDDLPGFKEIKSGGLDDFEKW